MKIIIVGDFQSKIHEQALLNAFLKLNQKVFKFAVGDYLKAKSFFIKIQNKFLFGPVLRRINYDLINYVESEKPDLVFIYRGNVILKNTVKKIKKMGILVFGYNNDDPFSSKHPFYLWRHFKKSIPYYDHIFVYRQKNLDDYKKIGYSHISLLRSYYIKEKNFPIENLSTNKYNCDVIFVGHYENDGRDEYIKELIDNNINIKVFGPEWRRSKYYQFFKKSLGYDIKPLELEDYNIAINSAKMALVFLSKLNNDSYTRRCFEITATKTFMLSEYSDDLNNLFRKGKEAEYFRNKKEIISKIKYYLLHNKERNKIAKAGHQRLLGGRHEVIDRVKEIIKVFNNYKS